MSEYAVINDLLFRGLEVMRAASPSCSCDLIVFKNNQFIRIEVRTAKRNRTGEKLYFPKNTKRDAGRQDVYALVVHESPTEIQYCTPDGLDWDPTLWAETVTLTPSDTPSDPHRKEP